MKIVSTLPVYYDVVVFTGRYPSVIIHVAQLLAGPGCNCATLAKIIDRTRV